MTIHVDALVERNQLQRRVSRWRVIALVVVVLLAASFFGAGERLAGGPHIARIEVDGIILRDNYRDEKIRELANNDAVKAVVLAIDSPGGTSIGGEQLFLALKEVAKAKPVVTVMGGMATSAAYLAAVAGEHVVAYEATVTGSIGVIFEIPDVRELADTIGIGVHKIATDPMKGEPSPLSPLSTEVRAVLQSVVDDFHHYFIEVVARERTMPADTVSTLADGRIYSARQALGYELIDAIGQEQDAISWLAAEKNLTDLPTKEVTLIRPEDEWKAMFGSVVRSMSQQIGVIYDAGLLSISKNML